MKTVFPSHKELHAALIANGRESGLRKFSLDSGWLAIDEAGDVQNRVPVSLRKDAGTPIQSRKCAPDPLLTQILNTARLDGWNMIEGPDGARLDLGGKRRAKANILFFEERHPSLGVMILSEPGLPSDGVAAFVLHLSTFLPRVRASLVDLDRGPELIWEAPLGPPEEIETNLTHALCGLAEAIRHGQAEAEIMARDETTAARWIEMNFPEPEKHKTNK